MTNIRTEGFWPELEEFDEHHRYPSFSGLQELFALRRETYRAFAEIEKGKGLLRPEMSLSTPEGQEAIRILVQRGLEEMVEAYDSHDHDHYLEELIDAVNYFWVMAIIDPSVELDTIINPIVHRLMNTPIDYRTGRITRKDLGNLLIELNPVFEKLRHRAWMNSVQSPYFDGWPEIIDFLAEHLILVRCQFMSWAEFVQYFVAKDRVLQFRIQTGY